MTPPPQLPPASYISIALTPTASLTSPSESPAPWYLMLFPISPLFAHLEVHCAPFLFPFHSSNELLPILQGLTQWSPLCEDFSDAHHTPPQGGMATASFELWLYFVPLWYCTW